MSKSIHDLMQIPGTMEDAPNLDAGVQWEIKDEEVPKALHTP